MPALGKYPAEVRDRAVRMVNEKLINEPALAVSTACRLVGEQVAINRNTLRNWMKQHHVDSGKAPGMASDDKQRIMVTCPPRLGPDVVRVVGFRLMGALPSVVGRCEITQR